MRVACDHGMIASLYTDLNDPDAFVSGYIEAVTNRHVLLSALTPWGIKDGWLLWRVADVLQVFTGDEYEARLELLTKLRGVKHEPLFESPPADADLLAYTLKYALENGITISVMTNNDTYSGRVLTLDDLRMSFDAVDFFGTSQRQPTILPVRDIKSVMIATEEEKMLDLLATAPEVGEIVTNETV